MRSEIDVHLTFRHVAQWSAGGTCYTVHAINFLGPVGVMVHAIHRDGREREGWLDVRNESDVVLEWEAGTDEDRTRRAEALLKT